MTARSKPITRPSPNHGDRRDGLTPHLIVLHYTAMQSAEAALDRLCAPEHEVSSHYLIGRDGALYQLVDEERRAWHAGQGVWGGRDDVNSRSIGVELDNPGDCPFSEPLMESLIALVADVRARWAIPVEGVIGHSDFAPARKFDPGRRFDWARLARVGQAVWPASADWQGAAVPERFLEKAARFGYPAEEGFEPVLSAFRQRFRPACHGPLDTTDMGLVADLAARFPVDRTPSSA